jgi:hypothetical protein
MRTVDPGKILMTFKGVNIVGIADGTFVEVERAEDGWTMYKGSDGEITRVRNRDRSGAVTFTLSQASITNTFLSAIAIADEKDGTGVGSLLIKDLNGETVYSAKEAWIRKIAKGEHAKEATTRQWVLDCAELTPVIGGQLI